MGDNLFNSGRRGPGRSERTEANELPDWVRQEQSRAALVAEIEDMFVPVSLRSIKAPVEAKMAQPIPVSFDRLRAEAFITSELSWGELGGDFIQRFMQEDYRLPEYTITDLHDRIVAERRYEYNPAISLPDLIDALNCATAVGLLEQAYRGDVVGGDRIFRMSPHSLEIDRLMRS